MNSGRPPREHSSPIAWGVWAIIVALLAATLVNAPVYIWVLHNQGGTALGTEPETDRYYLVQRRMIRTEADEDQDQEARTTLVDRETWAFNLYYTAATRLSFVLGLGCFLLLLGRALVSQYFTGGRDEAQGRPGRFSLQFAALVVAAFFALVAWEIGGKTIGSFLHSHSIYQSIQP